MVKIKKARWIIAFGVLALALGACGNSNATLTPPPTRGGTQTPWIIYVPVTTTPEPTLLPLLPTAEPKTTAIPTRAPTRATVVAKPTVVPTKPAAPVLSVAKPTGTPACSGSITRLDFPENGAPRTKGAAFEMRWTSSISGETDPNVGYKIELESRRGNKAVNSDAAYISHIKYFQEGKFVYDRNKVSNLAAGDDAVVTWKVTVVKVTGAFDDVQQTYSGNIVNCGSPSMPSQISLIGFGD
jgi:hypothetical protein